ncbi:Ribbon-helix-helix protein, copG family [Caldisphaera lagunensis DSM 15908]|uniref:Ribbon-helix-helix protein, copG family n=1 Tax=Caldisphaera lagunensis (strain DSM 15908 / JCM 11604 / ANMR 0165 / IC-154) TaxID=1056495 RepID=L0ADN4_CALLD|nr:ribbon-helix-helix protein, CopG family [Caldisphaera lagunensis]AFZ71145.1 Ribbon-helix-helix protein, copG family [Caldisphaera lagunensis DSM 15908]
MYEQNKRYDELRIISFRIDTETLYELDKITLKTKSNRSEIIRKAIEEYLKNEIVKR